MSAVSHHKPGVEGDAELERLRGAAAKADAPSEPSVSTAGLWAAIEEESQRETRSLRGRLRALKTSTRVLLAVGFAFFVAAAFLILTGHRTDLTLQTVIRYGVVMVGLLGLDALIFAVALRPAHKPALRWQTVGAIGLGLLIPVILSLIPELWMDELMPPEEEIFLCVVPGIITGSIVAVFVWILQRGNAPVWGRVLSVVVGGGVTGFAMLQMHCPARDAEHMLIGHATVGIAMVILSVILLGLRRLWRRRG